MRAYTLIGAGVGASLLGSPAVATAQTTTTELFAHSGLNCVPKPGDAAKLAYDFREGIRNTSTTASATVLCPADGKIYMQGTSVVPAGVGTVRVWVINRSSTASLSCTLEAIVANNGFTTTNTYTVKSMPAKTSGPLKWTGSDGIFAANYTYRISCKLPPASASGPSAVNQTDVEIFPPSPPPPTAGSARLP